MPIRKRNLDDADSSNRAPLVRVKSEEGGVNSEKRIARSRLFYRALLVFRIMYGINPGKRSNSNTADWAKGGNDSK